MTINEFIISIQNSVINLLIAKNCQGFMTGILLSRL